MIMKIKIYFFILIFSICLVSCDEDTKNYQLLFIGEVTDIDETGAMLNGSFINNTSKEIKEYGFVWGIRENLTSKITLRNPIKQGVFNYRITGNLYPESKYTVKAFVVINDSVYYSTAATFYSIGSSTVEISDFEPKTVFAGDTIIIYGRNFALNNLENIVSLNNQNLITISADTGFLKVFIPYDILSTKGKLTIEVSGKEVNSHDSLNIKDTWIKTTEDILLNSTANRVGLNGFYANNNLYLRYTESYPGFYEFNLNTRSIKKKTDYPKYGSSFMFTINDKGYLLFPSQRSLLEYNPVSDSWSEKSKFPSTNFANSYSMNLVIGDNAYIGLAYDQFSAEFSNVIWKYDSNKDKWSRMADFPGKTPRYATCFTYNNKAYVGLGSYYDPGLTYNNDIWEYDPVTNEWKIFTTFPGQTGNYFNSINFNNKLYAGKKDFWEYNFQTKKWKQIGDFTGNGFGKTLNVPFVANNSLYFASLITNQNNDEVTSFSLIKLNRNE